MAFDFKLKMRTALIAVLVIVGAAGISYGQSYEYLPGDVNMALGMWPPVVIGSDVTYLVNYFRGLPDASPCYLDDFWASADINGDCIIIGSDVTRLVNFFRGSGTIAYCVNNQPVWLTPGDLPEQAPSGWPNCQQAQDHPPILASIGLRQIAEGSNLAIRVTATDPDYNSITLLAQQLPDNAEFIDSTGGIGGFIFNPDYDQAGIYQVRFIARSTNLADTEIVQITVLNTNRRPVLAEIGSKSVIINSLLQFETSAADPDGTIPMMTATGLPGEASYIDNGNGTGSFSWQPASGDIGTYNVRFIASDGTLADSELVTIAVRDSTSGGIIADHTFCGLWPSIPTSLISQIVSENSIYYVHTSHGSQIVTGMTQVHEADSRFPDLNYYPNQIFDEVGDDLGYDSDTSWAAPTRSYLNSHPECTVVMYSWCGGVSENSENGINVYLNKLNELETQYPAVHFFYMTGHLDGSGPDGNLYQRNNQIRQYCVANDKILFDFADIESWDPDGNYYPDDSDACNWCYDWCADPENYCPDDCECAHSHCFNCFQKAKAWWVMMSYLEGWTGN